MPVKLPASIANDLFGKEFKIGGVRGTVKGIVPLIILLALAAQGVACTKPQPTCTVGNNAVDLQDYI